MQFSVVVPVYNAEKYLTKCIESIVGQEFKNFELILVDDGSTDNSSEICDAYAEKYENISVIHKANAGQVEARKDGVNKSKGEYILFADADDWYEQNALESLCAFIENDELDIVLFGFNEIRNGVIKRRRHRLASGVYSEEKGKLCSKMICDEDNLFKDVSIYPAVWCRAIRRELLLKWQDEVDSRLRIGEDLVLLVYCMLDSAIVGVLEDGLYNYRILNDSISHGYGDKFFKNLVLLKNNLEKAVLSEGKKYREQIALYVLQSLWNGIVKVCISNSKTEAINILKRDAEFNYLFDKVGNVIPLNIGYKMEVMLFLMRHKRWRLLFLLINLKFKGKK